MTEAWRSVPKKFCDLCKCWFYDNKVSIEHHERGARHKQNVQDKIRQISKKGREMEKADKETMKALVQMEVEALRSYKSDLKDQPDIAKNYNIHLNLASLPLKTKKDQPLEKQPKLNIKAGVSTIWREVLCPETKKSYFWNSISNETKWEPPSEGYLSLAEQAIESSMTSSNAQNLGDSNHEDDSAEENDVLEEAQPNLSGQNTIKTEEDDKSEEGTSSCSSEPEESSDEKIETPDNDEKSAEIKPKKRPFGDWMPVEVDEPETKERKLENKEKETKKIKFEEKKFPTVNNSSTGSKFKPLKAAGASAATFKKPKQGSNRKLRNREEDDE